MKVCLLGKLLSKLFFFECAKYWRLKNITQTVTYNQHMIAYHLDWPKLLNLLKLSWFWVLVLLFSIHSKGFSVRCFLYTSFPCLFPAFFLLFDLFHSLISLFAFFLLVVTLSAVLTSVPQSYFCSPHLTCFYCLCSLCHPVLVFCSWILAFCFLLSLFLELSFVMQSAFSYFHLPAWSLWVLFAKCDNCMLLIHFS